MRFGDVFTKSGVRITDTYFTGHTSVILPTLRRSVSAICRTDRDVFFFYIGVASGPDHAFALRRRIDKKKLERSVTDMYLLYASSSERNTKRLEEELIDHFKYLQSDDRIWNAAPGKEGRPSEGPNYYLYLAASKLDMSFAR